MKLSILIVMAALLAGCSATYIRVVDLTAKPIANAEIEPVSASMNLEVVRTDRRGVARLPYSPQEILWISVRKDGYRPVENLDVAESREILVELKREK